MLCPLPPALPLSAPPPAPRSYLHPATREWKEGLISVTFRDMSNNKVNKHQWIVLDGDIDAEWIESMNTVMDDNKMLTLASNERCVPGLGAAAAWRGAGL